MSNLHDLPDFRFDESIDDFLFGLRAMIPTRIYSKYKDQRWKEIAQLESLVLEKRMNVCEDLMRGLSDDFQLVFYGSTQDGKDLHMKWKPSDFRSH